MVGPAASIHRAPPFEPGCALSWCVCPLRPCCGVGRWWDFGHGSRTSCSLRPHTLRGGPRQRNQPGLGVSGPGCQQGRRASLAVPADSWECVRSFFNTASPSSGRRARIVWTATRSRGRTWAAGLSNGGIFLLRRGAGFDRCVGQTSSSWTWTCAGAGRRRTSTASHGQGPFRLATSIRWFVTKLITGAPVGQNVRLVFAAICRNQISVSPHRWGFQVIFPLTWLIAFQDIICRLGGNVAGSAALCLLSLRKQRFKSGNKLTSGSKGGGWKRSSVRQMEWASTQ